MWKQIVVLLGIGMLGALGWADVIYVDGSAGGAMGAYEFRVVNENSVYFADPNLESAVEAELGVSDPTPTDMLGLTSLSANNMGISDITGIEYALNIQILHMNGNNISDISPLSGLTDLTHLNLPVNHIDDILPLTNLINMETLILYQNLISDISPLSGLTNMTDLRLENNQISDISALSSLTNLNYLALHYNPVSDISALANMTSLETFIAYRCGLIVDVSPLANCTNLKHLRLENNQISDISALSSLTDLNYLALHYNPVSDISALANMTSLETFIAYRCGLIVDVSPLANCTNLKHLRLENNQISDISALSSLTDLNYLALHHNSLNQTAYCTYLPTIQENNFGIDLTYDPNPSPSAGDCNGDCRVNLGDFAVLASHWLELECGDCSGAEQTGDGNVLSDDLAVVAENWLNRDFFNFYENTLDNGPNWIIEGQWEFGQPSGLGGDSYGNPDPTSGFTGSNVFGVNLNGDYDASTPSGPYYLIAGPFNCTYLDNVNLKFARWLNTDESAYARSFVEASNNGTTWELVWEYNGRSALADNTWQTLEYDVSTVADGKETVYIRWGYEVLDSAYPYSGWNIDDVELWGSPNL